MGVIPKSAVRKFMNRKRRSFERWKEYRFKELNSKMRKLPVRPPIWKKLRKEQRVCLLIGAAVKRCAFFLDTGIGKTLLSIALARYFRKAKEAKRFLVLVPNNVNMYEWADQLREHSPRTKFTILDGSSAEKWEALRDEDSLLYIATYPGIMHMVSKTTENKKGETKFARDEKRCRELEARIDGYIFDESTELGGHSSLTWRCFRSFVRRPEKMVFALTGTPFGKDPKMLWSQMYLVDHGETLGPTLGLFQAGFYREVENHFSGFPEYKFRKKMAPVLHEMLQNRSIAYEADEATLPRLVPIIKTVRMSRDAVIHYDEAKAKFKAAVTSRGVRDLALIKNTFLRMRQISSGFIGYYDDDSGKRAALEFDDNPKLEMLLSIVSSIYEDHKVIIFNQFTFSGGMISRELTANKIEHVRIYGGVKNQEELLTRFKRDDSCRVMLLNNDCGGFGLNLQVARYGIYYESPTSPIIRKQTRRRFERQYSKHKSVFQYDLVTQGTNDEDNLKALAEGRDLLDSVLRGKKKVERFFV